MTRSQTEPLVDITLSEDRTLTFRQQLFTLSEKPDTFSPAVIATLQYLIETMTENE
jgi:hypothetical protein